jgi:hypothetical protein
MKKLGVEARLEFALATVVVLRALKLTDTTLHYHGLAKAIGLMAEDEPWHIRYRDLITDILSVAGAVAHQAGEGGLEFRRLVGADDEPGAGFYKKCRIVRD